MFNINSLSNHVGGTLVEYLARAHFSQEWGRATILSVKIDDGENTLTIVTDNKARLMTTDFSHTQMVTVNSVIYLIPPVSSYLDFYFSFAPKGVKIPTPDERGRHWNPFKPSD